jgi:D-alanine-D-alanine ligase
VRVAVLKGGSSLERQVSLRSAARVEDALASLGHEVIPIDADADLVRSLKELSPDVAFIALHGPGGEDGTPQALLEILGVPYTGPAVAACVRCMDKVLAKHLLREAGIPTPDWVAFNSTAFRELGAADALEEIEMRLGFPLVVKPAAQGSSLGVRFAASREDLPEALVSALSYDDRVLLERHVPGRELAVAVLDGEPLPVVEARPKEEDRFNYEARYEIGRTEYLCPAELPDDVAASVRDVASRTYEALGCAGFVRVDLMLDADERPEVLEANAIPGLTDTSLFPMAADAAGMSFEELVARIIELALEGRGPAVTQSRADAP